jgi:hypothetical protein
MAELNKLQSLQQQVAHWENKSTNYQKTLEIFSEYLQCIQKFDHPKDLINGYIRMGNYCEKMDDRMFSCDLYQEAINLLIKSGIGDKDHIQNLRNRINSLHTY